MGLMASNGSYLPIIQRPVSLIFVVASIALLAIPLYNRYRLK
jgi:TctA family transporter